ncbi:MAG: McrB family protein [Muribaculaceae bacterium]
MTLPSINSVKSNLQSNFNSSKFLNDRLLPTQFKELVTNIDTATITYSQYTCNVCAPSGLNIYFPNQWFYIAAYFSDYYKLLTQYKSKVFSILNIKGEEGKNKIKECVNNTGYTKSLFDSVGYNEPDKEYLINFLSNYDWWSGAKGIERGDFYVSPILSLANLVNTSQSYVAELCKFLSENEDALNILKQELAIPSTDVNLVVKRNLKDSYTIEELSEILTNYYKTIGSKGIHLFGFKYGKFLQEYSLNEIIRLAHLNDSYSRELIKMRSLYTLVKENKYGICFYEDAKMITLVDVEKNKQISGLEIYSAMRTKPFLLLAGISGTGKSRIVKQMAFESCPEIDTLRKDPTSPGNYQLIEVKPNWHDSTEVLGYESEIGSSHYVATPFVKFLVKAMQYEDKAPFFVCMDEMNLAPVEQYFAEFLSVLESRKLIDGEITSEPLIKADIFVKYESSLKAELFNLPKETTTSYGNSTSDTEALYGDFNIIYDRLKAEGLRIPSNLIVVGTVNMDETTHQFSRKVIDRAMTIEMNIEDAETPFKDFFECGDALHYYDNPHPKELFLPKVVQATDALAQLPDEDAEYLKANVPKLLFGLNTALNGTPFKIAYRVQNELVLYFYSLREEKPEESAKELLALAMDAILMMKVLPRIEGDEDLLEKPLKALADFTAAYPQASKKIAEMQQRLPQAHFTSFWP